MSVSVIRPQTSNLYKVQSKVILKSPKPSFAAAKIKRNLFGTVDQEENKKFVTQELWKLQKQATEKWGFDFQKERPLDSSRLQWISTKPQPAVYALTHAAHVICHIDSESTSSGDISDFDSPEKLMDERADRANNYREPTKKICDTTTPSVIKPTAFKPVILDNGSSLTKSKPSRRLSTPSPIQKHQEKRQPKITDFLPEKKKSLTTSSSAKKLSSHNPLISQYMTRRSSSSHKPSLSQ
ncbi:cyclin-dependent kinase inhibitor 1 [Culicoides brevitarsis]|uniref:cyclin-dependent kinase inhibitor 1 n=1 Tax=Culicoides brevitarsis TaxID=469753 RepID=UPI00307BB4F7